MIKRVVCLMLKSIDAFQFVTWFRGIKSMRVGVTNLYLPVGLMRGLTRTFSDAGYVRNASHCQPFIEL